MTETVIRNNLHCIRKCCILDINRIPAAALAAIAKRQLAYRPSSPFVMSVCLSFSPLVMIVNSGKTADSIDMTFGVVCWAGSRIKVLHGGPNSPYGKGHFGDGAAQCSV